VAGETEARHDAPTELTAGADTQLIDGLMALIRNQVVHMPVSRLRDFANGGSEVSLVVRDLSPAGELVRNVGPAAEAARNIDLTGLVGEEIRASGAGASDLVRQVTMMESIDAVATRRLLASAARSRPEQLNLIATWAEELADAHVAEPANAAWRRQVGPALSQVDVARLLGKSPQAVHKDRRLLRLTQPATRKPVYPVMQFHERRPIPGVAEVLAVLRDALLPESIAAWLTSSRTELEGRRPIDVLREMPADGRVVDLAHRLAASAA
jgi:hypothetical protein